MFEGLTADICKQAWEMILPSVKQAADSGLTTRFAGTIVVLNPHVTDPTNMMFVKFIELIDPDQDPKYSKIALAKAKLTNEHKLPGSVIQQQYPHLYRRGNVKWGGSTIDAGGLIVAFSGVQAVFDEMISEWMASAIRALCRHEMTRPDGGVMVSDYSYIGGAF